MEVIINHPYTETGQGHLPRNFLPANLVNLPSRKSPGNSVLPTINKYLIPAQDQHGFRREHSTTSALLQLTTGVAVGFNQRKPPGQTVCVAVDLLAAFDTDCHNNPLSKINRSQLPPATARWRSCYLRGRQAKKDANLDVCADCDTTPHDVKHLFVCPAHPTTLIPSDLWSRLTDAVCELSYLEARDPY